MKKRSKTIMIASCACVLMAAGSVPALAGPVYSVTDLGTLGGTRSTSTGISSNGSHVTGSSLTDSTANHAFAHTAGSMVDQGTLGGTSMGNAVNNSGQVAGTSNGTPSWLPAMSSKIWAR